MKIPKEAAEDLAWGYSSGEYVYVDRQFEREARWSNHYLIVFQADGNLYGFDFEEPATEIQEGQDSLYPDADGNIECFALNEREVVKIVYEKVKP